MLLWNQDIDELRWQEGLAGIGDPFFEGVWIDVTEEIWAVERAQDEGMDIPDIERHLAYLRDCATPDMTWAVAHPDDEYWQGL